MQNHQIVLATEPTGSLEEKCFELREKPVEIAPAGHVLCRTLLLSVDAANRAWIQGRTYREKVEAGAVMRGYALGEVVDANGTDVPIGTVVWGDLGWQEWTWMHPSELRRVTVRTELEHHLSVVGLTGVTAFLGLHDIGRPRAGETLLVSAAAGATGNLVGQLGLLAGLRVVGIAGGTTKTRLLTDELSFDAALDHRDPDLRDHLRTACPDGVDIYFDNVGGPSLDLALRRMNERGRIVCCGAVSLYDTDNPSAGPASVPGLLVTRRLRMEGFIVTDHMDRWDDIEKELTELLETRQLRPLEHIYEGLDSAPAALVDLLAGHNVGKQIVRVAATRP